MSREELLVLAERVESATGADRELDADVYAALGRRLRRAPGYPRAVAWCWWDAGRWHSMLPLTASLDAVLALVAEKGLSSRDVLVSALSKIDDMPADAGMIARYTLAEFLRTLQVPQ